MRDLITLLKEDIIEYIWHLDLNKRKKNITEVTLQDYILVCFKYPVFSFIKTLRICNYLSNKKAFKLLFFIERYKFRKLQIKFGIQTGYRFNPGGGFFIGHYSGIVIHQDSIIGKNFTIHQNSTIGTNDRGVPYIGDNVTCGSNVCIIIVICLTTFIYRFIKMLVLYM